MKKLINYISIGICFLLFNPITILYCFVTIISLIFNFEKAIIIPIQEHKYSSFYLILILTFWFFAFIFFFSYLAIKEIYDSKTAKLDCVYKQKEDTLIKEHEAKLSNLNNQEIELLSRKTKFKEITTGKDYLFGKIPQAIADVETIDFSITAEWLEHKPRPAKGTSEIIKREYRNKAKEAIVQQRIATYKLQLLLSAFPSLSEYLEDEQGIEELSQYSSYSELEEARDHSKDFLSAKEWDVLSTTQRNQLALDRYIQKRKTSNWAIGRDFEMSCAHTLKEQGYFVKLHGIEKRLEDLGRDLIASKIVDSKYEIMVIQCKYWGSNREIHENVIMQLYGTTIAYKIEHQIILDDIRMITPVLMIPSFSVLSDTAQKFAEILNIKIIRQDFVEYPRIKCNINGNSKIYHLPFDQQYDRTQIKDNGEFYAWTVKEAEEKGFRRAMRHNF